MRKRGCCGFRKKLPFGAKQRKGHVKWHLRPVLITTRSHQALSVVWRHHVALRRLWTRQLSRRPPKKTLQRHHRAPEQPRTPLMQPPARQRGAGSRLWPGAALLDALELVRRRSAPHAIAAAPHQAIPRRRRTAGDSVTTATSAARTVGRSPRLRVPEAAGALVRRARAQVLVLVVVNKQAINKPYFVASASQNPPKNSAISPTPSMSRPCHQCPTATVVPRRLPRRLVFDHDVHFTSHEPMAEGHPRCDVEPSVSSKKVSQEASVDATVLMSCCGTLLAHTSDIYIPRRRALV